MVVTTGGPAAVAAPLPRQARPRSRNPFRAQPTAYSPVSPAHLLDAAVHGIVFGDGREQVERMLRQQFGAREARLYDSGTGALQAAISHAASIVGVGAPVALPAFTCYEVATAAVGARCSIMLFDLDPDTLAPDIASLEAVLRAGAKTVVVSPLYGVPVDWDAIDDCVASYGAIAIEDAAQGHGAFWRGRALGTHGDIATLSFGRGKGWTASGGGVLLLRDSSGSPTTGSRAPSTTGLARELRVLAAGAAQWALGRPQVYGLPAAIPWLGLGETRYHEPSPLRAMTWTSARLLSRTQPAAIHEASARRDAGMRWDLDLPGSPEIRRVHPHHEGTPGYLRYPVRLSAGLAGFGAFLGEARKLGIASTYPSTLGQLPAVRAAFAGGPARWPGAEVLVRELATLPTHSLVTEDARGRIIELLAGYPAAAAASGR